MPELGGLQAAECRAEMRTRVVPERRDDVVIAEERVHDGALHAAPASMDESDFSEALLLRGPEILVNDRRDVAGQEGVEVELRVDWYRERHWQSGIGNW